MGLATKVVLDRSGHMDSDMNCIHRYNVAVVLHLPLVYNATWVL